MPLFSILLPTHNRADTLSYAIRSVLSQTVQDFELLVVGDGCTDNTAEVVAGFDDERIRWFDLPKGPHFGYANRNVALKTATGELIAFMAHDDLWLPDHLELTSTALGDPDLDLVYTRPLWVAPDGTMASLSYNLHDPAVQSLFLGFQSNRIPAGCVVHRRQCFEDYGYWNDSRVRCADWDMWLRIIEGGQRQRFDLIDTPTQLHFRAIWKSSDPGEMGAWREFYDRRDDLPALLKKRIAADSLGQATFWDWIAADPVGWTRSVRRALRVAIDRRILEESRLCSQISEKQNALQRAHAELKQTCQQQEATLENGEQQLQAAQSENSVLATRIVQLEEALSETRQSRDLESANLRAAVQQQQLLADTVQAEHEQMTAERAAWHHQREELRVALARAEERVAECDALRLHRDDLRAELNELKSQFADMQRNQTSARQKIEMLRAQRDTANAERNAVRRRVTFLEASAQQLAEVHNSAGWKLIQTARTLKQTLAPPSSRRETLWNTARDRVKSILRSS